MVEITEDCETKKMLIELYGEENIDFVEIPKVSALKHLINIVFKRGYGETRDVRRRIRNLIHNQYDFAFVDGSNYGKYADCLTEKGVGLLFSVTMWNTIIIV